MKLPISSNIWLLSTTLIYIFVFLVDVILYRFIEPIHLQAIWNMITALPLFIPMKQIINIDTLWQQKYRQK